MNTSQTLWALRTLRTRWSLSSRWTSLTDYSLRTLGTGSSLYALKSLGSLWTLWSLRTLRSHRTHSTCWPLNPGSTSRSCYTL